MAQIFTEEEFRNIEAKTPFEFSMFGKARWHRIVAQIEAKEPDTMLLLEYALRWAILMQFMMQKGSKLEEICCSMSNEASEELRILHSGASDAFSTNVLIRCWKHGRKLATLRSGYQSRFKRRLAKLRRSLQLF